MTSQVPQKENLEKNKKFLNQGDRLTREEFESRYHAMPDLKKAELINGVVYMASPLKIATHGEPQFILITWLGFYCAATPGIQGGDNSTVRLDTNNELQPDILLRIKKGQSNISLDGYVEGAPELIVEIAGSSVTYDLEEKFKVYQKSGVQEYIVWQTYENKIDWYHRHQEEYKKLKPDENGVIKSIVFPGLWLNITALIEGNLTQVLSRLQEGINTPEHSNFVKSLETKLG